MARTCLVPYCDQGHGLINGVICKKHLKRLQKGLPMTLPNESCRITSCPKPTRGGRQTLCNQHLRQEHPGAHLHDNGMIELILHGAYLLDSEPKNDYIIGEDDGRVSIPNDTVRSST